MKQYPIPLALPVFAGLAFISAGVNFFCGLPVANICIYIAGALCYGLLANIRIEMSSNIDYATSGELLSGLLCIIVMSNFFAVNFIIIFIILLIFVFLFDLVTDIILSRADSERLVFGFVLNTILITGGIFFTFKGDNTAGLQLSHFFGGLFHTADSGIKIAIALYLFLALFWFIFERLKPELRLYSQGKLFFTASGLNNNRFKILIYLVQAILSTVTTFCLGIFALPRLLDLPQKLFRDFRWAIVFPAIFYTQFFVLCSYQLSQTAAFIAVFILLFAASLLIYLKRRILN